MLKTLLRAALALAVTAASLHAAAQTSYDYLLLASSWEPGFCATHSTPECDNLAGTYAATSLSLHGLWPNNYDSNQPFFCGVPQRDIDLDNSHAWCSMDAYPISSATRNTLSTYMPGVASCLDKHEWFKHGTCANAASPDAYWNQASGMISRLGNTSFNAFLQANAGRTVTRNQLLSAFEGAFGSNTRGAVSLKCTKANGVSYFTEAWIAVKTNAAAQFPSAASLVTDGNTQGTCPTTGVFIAR
ncbi:ribonuclease [Burkholderia stagnalis]|uniref:ribonuclease T2 n=1 Tax=Burkholderia stagnalis TaxID=1503054 RepID=UPI0007547E53|nr:ribonuclease T2 [Burkholderia stagnalis]AOK56858.1 ribonuclease [Burkholderia stagnalis]KVN83892.1 ribonuclease [Burkholderia stagnalis]KWO36778.1 ribonuclease [Burkholderia stagnalis]KWO44707.1 ribonuclease [Burkholderia stagnalis]